MALKRMDNVAIVVSDLKAAIAFFSELGMKLVGETTVKGDWVDRVIGLKGAESDIALMQTPDGHSKIEFTKFKTPEISIPDVKNEQMNTLGKHRIMFAVDDIKDTVARLQTHGAELVDEIVQYEDMYLLCYLRGPDGIMLALAQEIVSDGRAPDPWHASE
jgi:catechol 2,3-dioxygenase-like lactoylglutathione lyase family enzyme